MYLRGRRRESYTGAAFRTGQADFSKEELLEEEIINSRRGKDFEERYLRKEFSGKITVYRVLDSRRENFKISKAYQNKVDIVNVITAPEIEMLIICNEGKYKDFEKRKICPPVNTVNLF